tara:strand:- start:2267 stop:2665 length:399 start_codon:yes stop_codon:yes gene_type:complete
MARFRYPKAVQKLRKEAKQYYKLVYENIAMGKDSQDIDIQTIIVLAIEYDKYLDASDLLKKPKEEGGGLLVKNNRGDMVPNPFIKIQNTAFNSMSKCWMSLGLTPEARKKISQGAEPGKARNRKRAQISVVK